MPGSNAITGDHDDRGLLHLANIFLIPKQTLKSRLITSNTLHPPQAFIVMSPELHANFYSWKEQSRQFYYVRIAIVTESFLPSTNGVTNSVIQVHRTLKTLGHEVMIIAPDAGSTPKQFDGSRVVRVAAINVNKVLPIALPNIFIERILRDFRPDVVHLASPALMGAFAQRSTLNLGIPTVAVYQTDYVGFSQHYKMKFASGFLNQLIRNIHGNATINLAPSEFAARSLRRAGVTKISIWGRGVDLELFNPVHRSPKLFSQGKISVGYVGRLAPEKSIHRLRYFSEHPTMQLVVIGDGPEMQQLQRLMPHAIFTGKLTGVELAQHVASLDLFIHPGDHETFCQAAQEALACGVPVIAPKEGAVREFVLDGVNGLTLDMSLDSSFEGLTESHWDFLLSHETRTSARRSVEDRSWAVINSQLIAHYELAISAMKFQQRRSAS
jgi:phosphatidylinositol alpha 1,6-mannosyltransferase